MAQRRMFAKTVIDSDAFLDMPIGAQLLYFHLAMRADDDGFVNKPKTIMRMCGAKDDDANILVAKKFLIPFDNGVVVIKHWKIHNYIAKDRYTETKYKEEKASLYLDENNAYTQNPLQLLEPCGESVYNPYTSRIQPVDKPETQVRLGKDSIGKDSIDNKRVSKETRSSKRFVKPTYEEVRDYCKERNNNIDAHAFIDFYESKGWRVGSNPMKDWKAAVRTWERRYGGAKHMEHNAEANMLGEFI